MIFSGIQNLKDLKLFPLQDLGFIGMFNPKSFSSIEKDSQKAITEILRPRFQDKLQILVSNMGLIADPWFQLQHKFPGRMFKLLLRMNLN